MKSKIQLLIYCISFSIPLFSQTDRWQQRVKYAMDVTLDVNSNRIAGKQNLEYFNNSPDTLRRVFFHLYWNAFQPGSMMDKRSLRQGNILVRKRREDVPDWDARVTDRISKLKPDEIGYQKVKTLKLNGRVQQLVEHETILEVILDRPILPRSKVIFDLEFEAQVPIQIRRSGRDNAQGIRFSMSQWYPKICEYDYEGWHPTPYIAREFYGVWGDFDVKMTIPKEYIIAATGYLQNPNQIGYGYEAAGSKVVRPAGPNLTWRFLAPNVHDFVWAADPDYKHVTTTVRDGLVLHAFYKISRPHLEKQFNELPAATKKPFKDVDEYISLYEYEWKNVVTDVASALPFIEKTFGRYPYRQYSFIHGGDGGMEYPMATLVKGPSQGTIIHEFMHSWYQMILGSNESKYAWMDEGFATYAENLVVALLKKSTSWPHSTDYASYLSIVKSEIEEPMTTHADHFNTNLAYTVSAYSKGCVFMEQLGYIVGATVRDSILLNYYNAWKFKHPNANDFIQIAEKTSGIKLDWYNEAWIATTNTIDYAFDSLWEENGVSKIRIKKLGSIPMPIDLQLNFRDSTKEIHYVPNDQMFGAKPSENDIPRVVYKPWRWTDNTYIIETKRKLSELLITEIDPSQRMADINRNNNKLTL